MVSFAQMNLASAVYVGRMDMIFCMNVLIYFSEERGARWYNGSTTRWNPAAICSSSLGVDLQDAGEVSGHCFETIAFSTGNRRRMNCRNRNS